MVSRYLDSNLSETARRVVEFHRQGLTPRQMAALLGLSVQRIYVHHRNLDLKPNPRRDEAGS